MFIDARTLADGEEIEADVCIVGAGPAGISLARELSGSGISVCLLESGGFESDAVTQALYSGESVGLPLELEGSRLRQFGGTTNHWTGWCRPLDPIDFEARGWLPHSGWPFGKDHLDPFYDRARALCETGSARFDIAEWESGDRPALRLSGGIAASAMFQFSPPTSFGQVYRADIERAPNVRAFLNANVIELVTCKTGAMLDRLVVQTLGGKRSFASSSIYVLAAGGIENARLLLASCATQSGGIGNGKDLVGRFFMEHPYFFSGRLEPSALAPSLALYAIPFTDRPRRHADAAGAFTFTESLQRTEGLLGCAVRLMALAPFASRDEYFSEGVASARRVLACAREGRIPAQLRKHVGSIVRGGRGIGVTLARRLGESLRPLPQLVLRTVVEQAPNPDCRVILSDRRDALGQRKARVDWRLGEAEWRSTARMHALLSAAFATGKVGEISVYLDAHKMRWPASLAPGGHHSGTTRMHRSSSSGVVDENCRVHGMANLFVAGSSVFPTIGYANPTLTIVALTLRLADHLRKLIVTGSV